MSIDQVNDISPRRQYVATPGQTVFPYPFPIFANADLVVIVNGVTKALATDYTVSGAGANTGGTVTFVVARAANDIVTIYRDIAVQRLTDFQQNGPWTATAINDELDRMTLVDQQLKSTILRSLRIPITANVADTDMLLDPAAWTGKYMTFDANGKPTPALLSSTVITKGNIVSLLQPAFTGVATDFANVQLSRTAAYSGGTVGNTIACLRVQSDVSSGVTNYEWPLLVVLNNSATGGQNSAGFFQGTKVVAGVGPTWAATFEARDLGGAANPTAGLIGIEVDTRTNGTDANLSRVVIDVVCTRTLSGGGGAFAGAATTVGYGVRVGSFGDSANVTIGAGYTVWQTNVGYAFDCANATVTAGALRMPAGAAILFDGPGVNQLLFDGTGLRYNVSNSPVARINQSGIMNLGVGIFGTGAAIITTVNAVTGGGQASYQMSDTLAGTIVTNGLLVQQSIAAATAVTGYRAVEIKDPTLNAGATITNESGIYVNDLTRGSTLNAALNLNVSAGATKYNVYAPGGAQNFFAGPMSFGTFTLAGVAQTGYITITDNTGVTRRLLVG